MAAVKYWSPIAISWLLWLAFTPLQAAADPARALEARLLATNDVIANFTQQVSNAQGRVIEQASGTLQVAKPNFRWEVLDPFPQIILARGDQLEIYDPDLEQVTTKSLEGGIEQAPLALLTQAELNLADHFQIELQHFEDERYILRPLSLDALFARMELVFRNATLLTLAIYDHTGQETLIRFSEYRAGQVIQSGVFELEYPPGTDFVRG